MPQQTENFAERWNVIANPGAEHTEQAFTDFIRGCGRGRKVLNCAVPLARAHALTDFQMPAGLTAGDCITTSVTGNFPDSLRDWKYQPKFCSEPQLPQLAPLPPEAATLQDLPWFESPSQSTGLGINARHVRYHHSLWQELKPKVLQGVHTTLVLALPQIGFALAPHIQLEKVFLFLGSLARGLGPAQLFPARYLYPDAHLGGLANMPAPIFADILPTTGGFAYPCVDCEPDPWRVLARFGNGDRYYGYPFRAATDSMQDFTLHDHEDRAMLLPSGQRVVARRSETCAYATLDPALQQELGLDREGFEDATCLLRGAVTHDGLPFSLPAPLQPLVFAIVLTHWRMELDRPGDLSSYAVFTQHAAIRGFNYFQRVEPYYSNFMRLIQNISADPNFRAYPLSNHLTHSWLGGNLRLSDHLSQSECDLGPELMRSYYYQQLDWQAGVVNLMNHAGLPGQERPGRDDLSHRPGDRESPGDGWPRLPPNAPVAAVRFASVSKTDQARCRSGRAIIPRSSNSTRSSKRKGCPGSERSVLGRLVEHGLRQSNPHLLARGQHPTLHIPKLFQIELADQSIDALRQTLDPVKQAEDTEILPHGQIPRERGIEGSEIRAPHRLGAVCRKSHPVDTDAVHSASAILSSL